MAIQDIWNSAKGILFPATARGALTGGLLRNNPPNLTQQGQGALLGGFFGPTRNQSNTGNSGQPIIPTIKSGTITSIPAKKASTTIKKGLTNLSNVRNTPGAGISTSPYSIYGATGGIAPALLPGGALYNGSNVASAPAKDSSVPAGYIKQTLTDGTTRIIPDPQQQNNQVGGNNMLNTGAETTNADWDTYIKNSADPQTKLAITTYENQYGSLTGQALSDFIANQQSQNQATQQQGMLTGQENAQEQAIRDSYTNLLSQTKTQQTDAGAMDTTGLANLGIDASMLSNHQQQVASANQQQIAGIENERDMLIQQAKMALTDKEISLANDLFNQARQKQQDAFTARQNANSQNQQMIQDSLNALNLQRQQRYMQVGNSLMDTQTNQFITDPSIMAKQAKYFTDASGNVTMFDPTTGEQASLGNIGKGDAVKYFTDTSGNVTKYDPATGQTAALGTLGKGTTGQFDPSKYAEVFNAGSSSPFYNVASDLADGSLTMTQFRTMFSYSRDLSTKLGVYDLAKKLNPAFDPAQFELGYKVASSPKIRQQISSLDNVANITSDFIGVSNDAARSGITALNRIINPVGYEIGGQGYTNFRDAVTAYADELSGALGFGSATDMSREMGYNMADPNLSPANFASALQTIVMPFIQSKRSSIINQMGQYSSDVNNMSGGNADSSSNSGDDSGWF